jgi:PhnB protein
MPANQIPPGCHTIQAYLVVKDAAAALKFYEKAFGMKEIMRMSPPGSGAIMHAELSYGDSTLMLSEENPQWGTQSPLALGNTPVTIHCYVPDVDATFNQAVAAGCTVIMPPADMFWGDRMAGVVDPFGHKWSLATHKEDVSPAEMDKRAAEFFAQQCSEQKS